ncbi:MAG TPA: tRNA (adenosine(37)-N6)-threonylcarbamoyltransferase complex dimerization subunit type 1 TsaB [Fimbriimonadaceae bacterium]|nr:tRNA (adenosine(37)-N6)-threonylcarbamoyltransferase complex dimerization subunit type 1 TsaB [Fimbriimonadaceae bacterium]
MIAAFSTSSPMASVALFRPDMSEWIGYEEPAAQAASGACLHMLLQCLFEWDATLRDVTFFLADLGPGSFTGVRVGVTLAKMLAFVNGVQAGGVDAFDLIDPAGTAVLPCRRGEWFIRVPGEPPYRSPDLPMASYRGYGGNICEPVYPRASRFALLRSHPVPLPAEALVPRYLIEPSISLPKKPYGADVAR